MGISGVPMDKDEIIRALNSNGGFVSYAAKSLGCSSNAIYHNAKKFPEVQEAIDQARKEYGTKLADLAEDALAKKVKEGDMTGIIFSLKTRGKSRGYEQDDSRGNTTVNLTVPNGSTKPPQLEDKKEPGKTIIDVMEKKGI